MNLVTFEEVRDAAEFDPAKLISMPPLTQSYGYGEWQREVGRSVRRFVGRRGSEAVCMLQLVEYPLAAGKKYWYAPYGPVWAAEENEEVFAALREKVEEIARESHAVFVRLDFSPPLGEEAATRAARYFGLAPMVTYRSSYFQPRTEWVLDLARSEEVLLQGMHHNTRYSIRAAERRGVETEVVEAGLLSGHFEEFYALLEETAARDGFSLHPREYYEAVFKISARGHGAFLVLSRYEKTLLAAHFIVLFGGQANFVFGGSSSSHRDRMGSYAAQWAAIRKAKASGALHYNFGGVSSNADIRESWGGLSSFKRKFGGSLLAHGPFWDFVANKFWYYAYGARKALGRLRG